MKRILFLVFLLLIFALLNCSNNDPILAPDSDDNTCIGMDPVSKNNPVDTSDTTGDDGDPWEDRPVDDGESGPDENEHEQGTGGDDGDKEDPVEPHDPGTGD